MFNVCMYNTYNGQIKNHMKCLYYKLKCCPIFDWICKMCFISF